MDEQALKNLRKIAADCPSDLDLHQLHVEELAPQDAARLEAHVTGCASCQARMEKRKAGFSAYPDVQPRPLLDAIQQRMEKLEAAKKSARQRFFRRATYISAPLAMAAALCIVLLSRREPPDSLPSTVREKGSLALYVYKLSGDHSQLTVSGDRFKAGDRLRFVADLPAPGHVNVLGIEASGHVYVAWPRTDDVPTLRDAGKRQELPGAAALDNSGGRETLYLIHCPADVGPPASVCQTRKAREAGAPPSCPNRCTLTPFVINKEKE